MIFAISILIGVSIGYIFREHKYYYLIPGLGKFEITKNFYEGADLSKTESYKNNVKEEITFDFGKALIFSFTSFGIMLLIFSFSKIKLFEKHRNK